MWTALIGGSYLLGRFIYFRWFAEQPPKPKPAQQIEIPRVDEGATVPMIYGKTRVKAPLLVWTSAADKTSGPGVGLFIYQLDMLFIIGIPFSWPHVTKIWRIWVGEQRLGPAGGIPMYTAFVGSVPFPWVIDNSVDPNDDVTGPIGGFLEIWDGRPTQELTDEAPGPYTNKTVTAQKMMASGIGGGHIPSYRGYLSVFHYASTLESWFIGYRPNIAAYQYEVSTYPGDSNALNVGDDANPARVIIDLLTGSFAKLNFPISLIDTASFTTAAIKLQEEGNGYSRSIEGGYDAGDIIREILEQIDGTLFVNPKTGKIQIKLIRKDYSLSDPSIKEITIANCEEIYDYAAGGFENIVNKVRIVFTNRATAYTDGSATAHNQAVASIQDGDVREAMIKMPGVHTQANANAIAQRELEARSRPISRCRAVVSRDFYDTLPGDVVKVTWPEYGIDGRAFRVADVSRGEADSNQITLMLIEDFYAYRGTFAGGLDPFPGQFEEA